MHTVRSHFLVYAGALVGAVLVVLGVVAYARDARPSSAPGDAARETSPASLPLPPAVASHSPPRGREDFVGSATCASCHRAEGQAYRGSHHEKALVTPTPELAKARFDGRHFTTKLGGTTSFALRATGPVVITPAADRKNEPFPIAYVSGVWPLEQYVVRAERGKLQSLGVVWDSRTPGEGGNQWFHVYGPDGIRPNDPLFFTSAAQNFNHVCADCHATRVERRYDVSEDRFDTRWAEPTVGCEACHGPGAEHVRSARAASLPRTITPLPARLRPSEPWTPSATGSPTPRQQDGIEVEVCAPCHSRRKPLKEAFIASDPFLDSFEPELLLPGRYHADGQVEGEVYEWASFLQSRMYHAGVRCSDCHDPHAGKLYAPGNALCVRCHEPARFDVPAHSHHAGTQAPRCIDCHMPPATFMQVDERRDHSIRIPRPDRSVEHGTPNACNTCHDKESAAWARDSVARWFPASRERPHFVDALASDRKGTLDAPRKLRTLTDNRAVPAMARATALARLGTYAGEKTVPALRAALASDEPLVVYGAVRGASELPLPQRASLLVPALGHPARAVRIAAGKALAGVPVAELPVSVRTALERAFTEVEQSFEVGASRADTHVERSAFELARGRLEAAEASLRTALRLEPCLTEAHLNLADLERRRGDEAAAERALRAALACNPKSAPAYHALGLWQVRAHRIDAALVNLRKAVELAPSDPHVSYVLAVALAGRGERDEAIRVLEAVLGARPNDAESLQALAGLLREAGESTRAAEVRQRLETLRQ